MEVKECNFDCDHCIYEDCIYGMETTPRRKEVEQRAESEIREKSNPEKVVSSELFHQSVDDFEFILKLPKIVTLIIGVFIFVWSIIDPAVFSTVEGSIYGEDLSTYGIMGAGSFFGAMAIWWLIGGALCGIVYFVMKISMSYKLLKLYYLQEIYQSVKK